MVQSPHPHSVPNAPRRIANEATVYTGISLLQQERSSTSVALTAFSNPSSHRASQGVVLGELGSFDWKRTELPGCGAAFHFTLPCWALCYQKPSFVHIHL